MKKKIYQTKKEIFFGGIIVFSLILFWGFFKTYFFQDDFFHLNVSKAKNLKDFFLFFNPKNLGLTGFYRPLSVQVYYFLCRKIFGLNPFWYHLVNYLIYLFTVLIVFKIFDLIFKNDFHSYLATFLYAFSSFHFVSLNIIWDIQDLLSGFFYFLSFLFYLKRKNISLLFFIFSFLSKETALTLPFVILIFELLNNKNLTKIISFFLVLFVFLGIRIALKIFPALGVYQIKISPKLIFNNYIWYFLWSVGVPESLVDFVSFPKINPRFFREVQQIYCSYCCKY